MKEAVLLSLRSIRSELRWYRKASWAERWDHLVNGGAGKWGGGVPPV
jgi:hypothetical protein